MNYVIWVTTACNLCCRYCYEGNNKSNLRLSKEKCDDILRFVRGDLMNNEDSELLIDFHGGEPFLEFESIKYLVEQLLKEYSGQRKVIFGTTTNATIITDEILEFIVRYIPEITVSLDGTKDLHDYLRKYKNGKGSYDAVMKNSLRILDKIPNVRVRMTVNTEGVESLAEGVRNLVKHGFKIIVPAVDLFDKRWNDSMLYKLKEQIQEIQDFIHDKREVTVSLCDPVRMRERGICSGGLNSRNIYTDGSIYPCMMAGGVEEFKIGDIYSGIDYEKLSGILSYNHKSYVECQNCVLINSCNGNRCKIINRLVTGDYILPPVMECELNHILYSLNGIECYI